jgi:hypothetical protein
LSELKEALAHAAAPFPPPSTTDPSPPASSTTESDIAAQPSSEEVESDRFGLAMIGVEWGGKFKTIRVDCSKNIGDARVGYGFG